MESESRRDVSRLSEMDEEISRSGVLQILRSLPLLLGRISRHFGRIRGNSKIRNFLVII